MGQLLAAYNFSTIQKTFLFDPDYNFIHQMNLSMFVILWEETKNAKDKQSDKQKHCIINFYLSG